MSARRRHAATRATRQAIELALAVPAVVAHRLSRLAAAGPSPSARDRSEFQRMSAEKIAAFYESWNAMYAEIFHAYLRFWFSPQTWMPHALLATAARRGSRQQQTALAVMTAAMAPVHRRAVANARRLGRARRR